MSQHETAMQASMVSQYGPLLTLAQLAELLHRSPDGLRIALRGTQPYAHRINEARIRIGRRVYFRTAVIAAYLATASAEAAASLAHMCGVTRQDGVELPQAR